MKTFLFAMTICIISNTVAQTTAPQKPKYFPLKKGNEWTYTSSTFEPFSNGDKKKSYPLAKSQTFNYHITDTATVDHKKYFMVMDNDNHLIQIIRFDKVTGFYYSRILLNDVKKYSPEKLFLKNYLPLKASWTVGKNADKITFKVMAVIKDTMIRDVPYKNVIELHENIPNLKLDKIIVIKHWYAENVGEVATYISYPLSNTFGDMKLELSSYPEGR
ncbi:MAG: hypothetical protein JWN78_2062 [Bacteroidota bacterium]|nr:hypothetical protein [Bacteroidota bacterium]